MDDLRSSLEERFGCYLEVNDGWLSLLKELADNLDAVRSISSYSVGQIKQKYGWLDVNGLHVEAAPVDLPKGLPVTEPMLGPLESANIEVNLVQAKALRTCEFCGGEGERKTVRGWIWVVCPECQASRLER
jgi:hypothetical protein